MYCGIVSSKFEQNYNYNNKTLKFRNIKLTKLGKTTRKLFTSSVGCKDKT